MLRRLRIENFVLIREADLSFAPGLNAVTGETGAGKTILAQAIGLLLGAAGDSGYLGPEAEEAYVEAELDLPDGILDDPDVAAVAELRPGGEDGLVAARRVFADGRTRAYAWGRAVPREELAALVERLLAMSGQFEQRRLARTSHQLEVLDAFAGEAQVHRRAEMARAWRELAAARRRHADLEGSAADRAERLAELEELVARSEGLEPETEDELRSERERLRHVTELAGGVAAAAELVSPEAGERGAAELAGQASRQLEPVLEIDPGLGATVAHVRDSYERLREASGELRAYLLSLEADPGRLEVVEGELARIEELKRRFAAGTYEDLLAHAAEARAELHSADGGAGALAAATESLEAAETRADELTRALSGARAGAVPAFAEAVAAELQGLGLGEGEFRVELAPREPGASGADEIAFLIRPNPGLPFVPAAETASGGELSRIALALRAVAHAGGGEPTIVFDEIDTGIGGRTAHAVANALARLAARAQVLTITHLPQIASVADGHFRVEKVPGDPTHTRITQLEDEERRDELERMLGGAEFLSTVRGA